MTVSRVNLRIDITPVSKKFRLCIGERLLAYWPQVGEAKHREPVYIEKTRDREDIKGKIIYLDFETYVKCIDNETGEEFTGDAYSDIPLSYFNQEGYVPFPCVDADRNTSKYTYHQSTTAELNMKMGMCSCSVQ